MLEFWRKPYLNLQSTKYYFKNNFNQAFHWRRPTGPQSLTHLCDSEGLRMGEPVTALTFFIFLFGIIKFNASLCGASVFSFLLLPFWLPWPQRPDRVTGAETGWHWATGSHHSHSELYTGHGEDLLFRLSTVGSRVMVNSWLWSNEGAHAYLSVFCSGCHMFLSGTLTFFMPDSLYGWCVSQSPSTHAPTSHFASHVQTNAASWFSRMAAGKHEMFLKTGKYWYKF